MVYALHNFNATVEGQANAAKGEHMVLLDDSNSYWWLVRIVRDSSIGLSRLRYPLLRGWSLYIKKLGYLPAEHIETPTERLARLNKHRNIDLAANMLSDSVHEKSKNPLKKAIRRRNAKTVTFTNPTYHEPSEYDYTTEEEDEDGDGVEGDDYDDEEENTQTRDLEEGQAERDQPAVQNNGGAGEKLAKSSVNVINPPGYDTRTARDKNGEETAKMRPNPTPASLRHPDSAIFHDETAGTKKLTLTPNLLRDDAGGNNPTKPEVIKGRSSLDREKQFQQPKREDNVTSPPPPGKRPRKGSSVLNKLFKKGNRRGRKEEEDEIDEWLQGSEKQSIDSNRSNDSGMAREVASEEIKREKDEGQIREEQKRREEAQREQQQQQQKSREEREREAQKQREQQTISATASTIRRVDSEPKDNPTSTSQTRGHLEAGLAPTMQGRNSKSPTETRRTPEPGRDDRVAPVSLFREAAESPNPGLQSQDRKVSVDRLVQSPSSASHRFPHTERLSESPEHITFHDAAERPDLILDTSPSPASNATSSSANSSPEMIGRSSTFDSLTSPGTTVTPAPDNIGGHAMARTWSDWSLRTYFEDDNDVRDMLIVVQQDKGDTVPTKEHPEIAPLFAESTRKLADITRVQSISPRRWECYQS
jgi:hypothetical protein